MNRVKSRIDPIINDCKNKTILKVVTSSNLNAFKGEVEAWCNKGYIPEWRSFKADIKENKFIIFMVKLWKIG